jgi:amino acid efflux transporter
VEGTADPRTHARTPPPATELPATPLSAWQAGRSLAGGVLGAGLLLSAPVTAGLAGRLAWLAWLTQLIVGGAFCFAVGRLARYRGRAGGLADLVATTWGSAGGRLITALYLAGFITGQAAIALAAGDLIDYALGRPGTVTLAVGVAIGIVAVAAAVAAAGLRVPDPARRWRLWLALALGLALCADPILLHGSGLRPGTGQEFWPAVFLLLFAGVGWERSAALAVRLPGTRRLATAVLIGWVMVAAGYLLVGLTAASAGLSGSSPWPHGASALLAAAAAAALASFCATNVEAAAGFLGALSPGRPGTLAGRAGSVGAVVALILLSTVRTGWQSWQLLAGPAAATLLIYCAALCSGWRTASWELRRTLAAALSMLAFLAAATAWFVLRV